MLALIVTIIATENNLNGKLLRLFHRQLLRAGWGSVRAQVLHA